MEFLHLTGIGIHSHHNGLALDTATHYTTLPRAYTEAVNKVIVLADAGGQDAVLAALREIAKGILAGSFP